MALMSMSLPRPISPKAAKCGLNLRRGALPIWRLRGASAVAGLLKVAEAGSVVASMSEDWGVNSSGIVASDPDAS